MSNDLRVRGGGRRHGYGASAYFDVHGGRGLIWVSRGLPVPAHSDTGDGVVWDGAQSAGGGWVSGGSPELKLMAGS